MMTKKTMIKIISGVVIGGSLLSIGTIAFADNVNKSNADKKPGTHMGMMRGGKGGPAGKANPNMQGQMQSALKELVAGGTITQAKADEFLAFTTKKQEEMKAQFDKFKSMTPEERKAAFDKDKANKPEKRADILDEAVTQNIFTKEQVTAIRDKMHQTADANRQKQMNDSLGALVKDNKITQAQMDKIVESIGNQAKQMKEIMDKTKDMTPEQRREYMKSNAGDKVDPISKLVNDGTITKDQGDAVKKALRGKQGPKGGFGGQRGPKDQKRNQSSGSEQKQQ